MTRRSAIGPELAARWLLLGGPALVALAGGLLMQGNGSGPRLSLPFLVAGLVLVLSIRIERRADRRGAARLAMDDELVQTQRLASLGELSAGIAHEINTPLGIIGQEAELMGHYLAELPVDQPASAALRDSVGQIAGQVARCRDVTHRLLLLARRSSPLVQEIDVNALVEDMVQLVEKEALRRGVSVSRFYDPALGQDFPVRTDPQMLRQVVLNLLGNAAKAVSDGGRIDVATRRGDHRLEIEVQDSGAGIAPENLSKIFTPFFTTRPPGQGTGLGLAIASGLAERLDGRILVENAPGSGARFTVRLPT